MLFQATGDSAFCARELGWVMGACAGAAIIASGRALLLSNCNHTDKLKKSIAGLQVLTPTNLSHQIPIA